MLLDNNHLEPFEVEVGDASIAADGDRDVP